MKILPVLTAVFRRPKRPEGLSWRMDETYVKVAVQWKYLYRAVDRDADAIDFLLRAKRDHAAARQFLERAIGLHGVTEKINVDKSGANTAAIQSIKDDSDADIELRQRNTSTTLSSKTIGPSKRIVRPKLGFKSFNCPRILVAGIENAHMINSTAPKVKPRPQRQSSTRSQFERPATACSAGLPGVTSTEPPIAPRRARVGVSRW